MGTYKKLPELDYAYDATEFEHYFQLSDAVDTIRKDLDGYLTSDSKANADGYIAFFNSSTNLEGDNDLFWNRESNRLEIKGQGIYNPDGSVVLGTNATPSVISDSAGNVICGGDLEVDGYAAFDDGIGVDGYATFRSPLIYAPASKTLGAGDSSFAAESSLMLLTADAGGNTITAIMGGQAGMLLTIVGVSGTTTFTNSDVSSAQDNQMVLSDSYALTAGKALTLVSTGSYWVETSWADNAVLG